MLRGQLLPQQRLAFGIGIIILLLVVAQSEEERNQNDKKSYSSAFYRNGDEIKDGTGMIKYIGYDKQSSFDEYGDEPGNIIWVPDWEFSFRESEGLNCEDEDRREDINLGRVSVQSRVMILMFKNSVGRTIGIRNGVGN